MFAKVLVRNPYPKEDHHYHNHVISLANKPTRGGYFESKPNNEDFQSLSINLQHQGFKKKKNVDPQGVSVVSWYDLQGA